LRSTRLCFVVLTVIALVGAAAALASASLKSFSLTRHGNATVGQFIDLAEEVSGRDLSGLFRRWLYRRGKPRVEW